MLTAAQFECHIPRRAPPLTNERPLPIEGEDIETTHWEDAHHWMSIYLDLLEFKRGILDRIRRDLARLPPAARLAAAADITFIESQMEGYQKRFTLWYRRVLELQGLRLDAEGRVVRYGHEEATLTVREFQLFQFLLDHPHRYFTVPQILGQAWAEPGLFPEEVRNYVRRIRRVLAALDLPCDLVNRPGRGYAIEFRENK
ncbi:MAG TPA: winged helix-turn-helix domain-containing protein [Candidatus Dormibacteraeota bacterium]